GAVVRDGQARAEVAGGGGEEGGPLGSAVSGGLEVGPQGAPGAGDEDEAADRGDVGEVPAGRGPGRGAFERGLVGARGEGLGEAVEGAGERDAGGAEAGAGPVVVHGCS